MATQAKRIRPKGDDGYAALAKVQNARWAKMRPAWVVAEGECLQFHCHRAMTLDQVIAEQVEDLTPTRPGDWDRSVWQGERCLAILRPRADGTVEVIRLNGTAGDCP